MLVLMVGAGNALEKGISSQIEGFATNSCFFLQQKIRRSLTKVSVKEEDGT